MQAGISGDRVPYYSYKRARSLICRPAIRITRPCCPQQHMRPLRRGPSTMDKRRSSVVPEAQKDVQKTRVSVPEPITDSEKGGATSDGFPTTPTEKTKLLEKDRAGGVKIMGLSPSPELLAISMVYFVQGILGLARLAISYFYKDEYHLDPSTVAVLTGLGAAPWVVKPLYGFLSDTVPIFGYKRRSYLIICGILGTVSWAAMATVVNSPSAAVVAIIIGSLSTACSDVVVDSIVVERSRGAPQSIAGSLQSLCWASSAIGGVASAYFSGSLIDSYGTRGVFGLTAVFPLIVSLSAVLIAESPVQLRNPRPTDGFLGVMGEQLKEQSAALWDAVNQRGILLPALFVFLWQATPTADTAFFYFETNKLGFTPEFLGRVRLVGSIASLAGVATYNYCLKEVPLQKMFWWTAVIGTALGSTQLILITGLNEQLGLSNELFVLGDSLVLTVLGQVSFMPILVLAARLCPEGVEATLFATLMSILNGGSFMGSFLGGVLTGWFGVTADNFDNLAPLVLLCTLSSLAPLPLLKLVPNTSPTEEQQLREEGKESSSL